MPAKSKPARYRGPSIPESLRARIEAINKQSGGQVARLGTSVLRYNCIPPGPLSLAMALLGGPPEGQATMVYGYESGGKSLLLNLCIAGFQAKHVNQFAVVVDAEKLYDKDWAERLGVDLSRLIVIEVATGEEAADNIRTFMADPNVGFVGLDSIPACVPRGTAYNKKGDKEEARSTEDKTMGSLAALMGQMNSMILLSWGEQRRLGHQVTVMTINQWRNKIGGFSKDPRHLPGGFQINHLPSTKIEVKKGDMTEETTDASLEQVKRREFHFKIDKRKHGQSIDRGAYTIVLAPDSEDGLPQGAIDDYATTRIYAQKFGLFSGSAGRYKFPLFTEATFAKHVDAERWLRDNPDSYRLIRATIIAAVRVAAGLDPVPPDDYLEGVRNVSTLLPELPSAAAVQDAVELVEATDASDTELQDDSNGAT
jgi:RecA/RadA recombinase